ncbi:hypothetical protein BXZ70DRAFT_803581 [Cristinia sonorae]|uniref:Uncharacterized protein n=1 Tax=Cristinia sonorae TaxID=1940300 RepID=A0A8K0XRX1_9AGAR|nr:hypothetical protein BXZ70DRAFT_803581 [Cristinia sonorae]
MLPVYPWYCRRVLQLVWSLSIAVGRICAVRHLALFNRASRRRGFSQRRSAWYCCVIIRFVSPHGWQRCEAFLDMRSIDEGARVGIEEFGMRNGVWYMMCSSDSCGTEQVVIHCPHAVSNLSIPS